jgi:beta-glucosidase-like glycosyl hydrolase/CubicO group peptidase (beta-lactamase class C family)
MKKFPTFLFAFVVFSVLFIIFSRAKNDVIGMIQEKTQLKPKKEKVDFSKMTKQQWVNYWMKKLTLEQKVAQMIMPDARGVFLARNSKEFKKLVHYVKDRKVGGLIFFRGDVFETADMINYFQKISDVPLLISADFEWGTAMRLDNTTHFPPAMGIAATGNPDYAYEVGRIIAIEGRAIGIHQNYAPTVDVNNNYRNPIINIRSFGETPEIVSKFSIPFIKGLQENGMIATAKHFPGHGDTDIDSHLDLPVINHSKARIDSIELPPFKDAINFGVKSIMVAHISFPQLDTAKNLPATLSYNIITGLLKKELGFKGLIVTDAMTMRGVTKLYSNALASVLAVKAGNDIILMPPNVDEAIDAIVKAVKRGEISEERINESVKKILEFKYELGLHKNRFVDVDKIRDVVATEENLRKAKEISRASITVVKNENILPLIQFGDKKILHITIVDSNDPNSGSYFISQLSQRYDNISFERVDLRSTNGELNSILSKINNFDIVIVSAYVRVRAYQSSLSLVEKHAKFLRQVINSGKPVILISFGNPYIVMDYPDVKAYICSYSDAQPVVEATAEVLFGEISPQGKLPINIPGFAKIGTGLTYPQTTLRYGYPDEAGFDPNKLSKLDTLLEKAIQDSATPGAVLLVARNGVIAYHKAFGTYTYDPYSRQVEPNSVYDMASITKVAATTISIMKLYDEGKINLDDPVAKYIPKFAQNGKDKVTIKNLLLHNSGLPSWKPFYQLCKSPSEILDSIYAQPLVYKTGDSTVYSDLGFITLGKIVEVVTGKPLDQYVKETFYIPLGMKYTTFLPPKDWLGIIAPTEFDSASGSFIYGVVHDENARALGGVSGHAGLFSNARDLAVLMQMILNGGEYGGIRFFKKETVDLFTKRWQNNRGLGWDNALSPYGKSALDGAFGENAFGHTGFTGTSVYVYPEKKLIAVLLTNRVHPTRANTKHIPLRKAVHKAIVEALVN